jgi:DNA-binding NarL/FixJ family response regulator
MSTEVAGPVQRGEDALAAGDWEAAKTFFGSVLEKAPSPEAAEGLGRALWWLQDSDAAISHTEHAYAAYRARGDLERAAGMALWLSREYQAARGNSAASNGWFARAEGLLRDGEPSVDRGWLGLTRAERTADPGEMRRHALEAREIAERAGDPDLETAALARLGYAEVAEGDVVSGTDKLDEAMAAATGGEVRSLEVIGDVTCVAIAAFELASDWKRIEQWGQVVDSWIRNHNHVPVLGFCYACCAEMFLASGEWEQAEGLLAEGLGALRATGHRSRCVHPAAKLAELRLTQGRLEEAEQLLAGFEGLPEASHPLARLSLLRGEHALAAAALHRRLNRIGDDNVLAAPFLALLSEVQLAQSDLDGAASTVERLAGIAERSGIGRVDAAAQLVRGRVALARAEPSAIEHLERALARFSDEGMPVEAARARLELARALEGTQPEVSIEEARTALAEFERVSAPRDADAAADLLRRHGVRGRTGPKDVGLLTRREEEVLHLVAQGLTNPEIAARLFVSTKTVGHHVSNVLSKLGVRTRGEAAAWALRTPGGDRAQR